MIPLRLVTPPEIVGHSEPDAPISLDRISIELTNLCNKGCSFCYNQSSAMGATFWKADELITFVTDVAANGVRAVSFGGGEPLQYPALFDVLDGLKGKMFRSLTTNGLLLKKFWSSLVNSQPEKVHLSIHFPENVGEISRVIRQVHDLEQAGIRSGINLLVQRSKLAAVSRTVKYIHHSGISNDRIVYLPMRGQDTPDPKQIAAIADGPFQSMTCLTHCHRSSRFCSVGWKGDVAWCSYTRSRKHLTELTYHHLVETLSQLDLEYCGHG